MKKCTSKLLALMLVLVMAFALTACGDKKDASEGSATADVTATDDATATDAAETDAAETEEPTKSGSSSSSYSSVEEYVNSPEVQNSLSALETQLKGSGMSIKVSADGNKLIYTYKYENTEKKDGMAESLEKALSAQDATFQATANQIKSTVKVDSASVVIEYIDSKDEMIYTKEYKAE